MVPESNLHLYDTEERPGVPAGIVVSIEETETRLKHGSATKPLKTTPNTIPPGICSKTNTTPDSRISARSIKSGVNSKQGLGTGLQHRSPPSL